MFPEYRNSFGLVVALHADAAVSNCSDECAYVALHPAPRLGNYIKTNNSTNKLTQHLCYRSAQMALQVVGFKKPRLPLSSFERIQTLRFHVH